MRARPPGAREKRGSDTHRAMVTDRVHHRMLRTYIGSKLVFNRGK